MARCSPQSSCSGAAILPVHALYGSTVQFPDKHAESCTDCFVLPVQAPRGSQCSTQTRTCAAAALPAPDDAFCISCCVLPAGAVGATVQFPEKICQALHQCYVLPVQAPCGPRCSSRTQMCAAAVLPARAWATTPSASRPTTWLDLPCASSAATTPFPACPPAACEAPAIALLPFKFPPSCLAALLVHSLYCSSGNVGPSSRWHARPRLLKPLPCPARHCPFDHPLTACLGSLSSWFQLH